MYRIEIGDILNYKSKKKSHSDYNHGGWYLILNKLNNKRYIGKSIEYMFRLKQHLNLKNPKTVIDKEIKIIGYENFEFYLLNHYNEYNINFFNRKLEVKIENELIKQIKSYHPFGYNIKFYE